jgi:hypothetical protein
VVRVREVRSIEEEWESFKVVILRTLEAVCGWRTGGTKVEWWCEETAVAVREKRQAFAK